MLIKTDGQVRNDLEHRITQEVDLTPLGIIDRFGLGTNVQLADTTNYGHFGNPNFPWENLNL